MKTAIITGASAGIGRQTATVLAQTGEWNLVVTARRLDQLEVTQSLCKVPDGVDTGILVVAGDVTDEVFVKDLFAKTIARFGRLDMLFNNAGRASPPVPLEDVSLADFSDVLKVNVIGPFLCSREAFRIFKSQSPQGGRIINNGSIAAHSPRPMYSPYTTSKHALTGLTRNMALDGRAYNISITQIDEGSTATELAISVAEKALQGDGSVRKEPLMDMAQVANAVKYVAGLPNDVEVLNLTILATKSPFVGRG